MKKPYFAVFALLAGAAHLPASDVLWSSPSTKQWLTSTNWTGSAVPGAGDVAQFGANPTANDINIRFSDPTNNGAQNQIVGAIELTAARSATLENIQITNNATNTPGTLTLAGVTVNGMANVILRNNSSEKLEINNGAGASTTAVALGNATNNRVVIDNDGNVEINATVTGTGRPLEITGTGTGRLDLTGTNTFTGNISITGAEVRLSSSASAGNAANTITVDGGRLGIVSGGSVDLSARSIFLGQTTGTSISAPNSDIAIAVLTYNGVLANKPGATGVLVKQGAGILDLGGVSTFTGDTSINNGTLRLTTGNNRLPTGTTVSLGQAASDNLGTLDLNGRNQQIAGLNSTSGLNTTLSDNTVTSGTSATLTLGGSGTYSYGDGTNANSGVLTGALAVTKTGSGTQTLGDANTYSGGTTISGGTLVAASTSALGTGAVTVSGGTLASTTPVTLGGNFTMSSGTLAIGQGTASQITLATNKAFSLSGGTWTLTILGPSSFDSIAGSGASSLFSITGGVLDLAGSSLEIGTYDILTGFGSGSGDFTSIVGYDNSQFTVTFDTSTSGIGRLQVAAVPEPETLSLALVSGILLVLISPGIRRRMLAPAVARRARRR